MRYKSGMAAMVLSLALVCTGCASQADQFYSEGVASLEAGQYEAAVTYFQQGVETKQRLAENYRGLGIAYYNTGDYASAVTVLKQSLEEMDTVNDAFTIDVYYYLAEAYRARGELVRSAEAYTKLLEYTKWVSQSGKYCIPRRSSMPRGAPLAPLRPITNLFFIIHLILSVSLILPRREAPYHNDDGSI